MKKSALILIGLLSLNVVAVMAQENHPSPKETITKMDINKDGKIAKSEAKGHLLEKFDTIDSNKDGFVTEAELEANKPKREEMDTNKDGKISKSEAKGHLLEKFDTIDTDKDGFLSEAEMKTCKDEKSCKGKKKSCSK